MPSLVVTSETGIASPLGLVRQGAIVALGTAPSGGDAILWEDSATDRILWEDSGTDVILWEDA